MIIHKVWVKRSNGGLKEDRYEGWFLLGLVPLYIHVTGYIGL